jgi:hypothetical protein
LSDKFNSDVYQSITTSTLHEAAMPKIREISQKQLIIQKN